MGGTKAIKSHGNAYKNTINKSLNLPYRDIHLIISKIKEINSKTYLICY